MQKRLGIYCSLPLLDNPKFAVNRQPDGLFDLSIRDERSDGIFIPNVTEESLVEMAETLVAAVQAIPRAPAEPSGSVQVEVAHVV